ncbi:tetratricopeptide repeat protein [Streptomyces sp. NPDC059445]|uniref:tetratricopeptide repeat protein n=1 Tax=Streptomyces sp. NPDC059445 TaxID=3346832 RepID=UPI0036A1BAA5
MGGGSDEREAALTELRKRLEDTLANAGLTEVQLATRTGLSRTTVQTAFQSDGPVPSGATVAALTGKLGLSAEQKRELLELRRTAAGETAGPVRVRDERLGKAIGEWDPHDLEVHPAGTATITASLDTRAQQALPGYVRRAHDCALDDAVGEAAKGRSRMLVMVGSSSTGKTRACWEAVQPLAAKAWRLWHPYDPTRAEAALADLDRVGPRTVVWLNEAQHYLGDPQVGERIAAALHTLLTHADRGPVLVLGTLWPEYANAYTRLPASEGPDPHRRVRELLTGRTLTVPSTFDEEALQAASALARDGDRFMEDVLTRAQSHGRIAQDLAGAPELVRRYEQGTPPVKALLEAAMDARRLGVGLHLPHAFLSEAATDYLTDDDYDQLTEDWAEAAFAALAHPVHGRQVPLRRTTTRTSRAPAPAATPAPVPGPVFRLADYLEQHGRTTRRTLCPPASFWHAAHTHLTDPDALHNLATAAHRRQRLQWAHRLWRKVADAGRPDALSNLARLRDEIGDREGAKALARQAANAGQPFAQIDLVRQQERAGDREGAEALARQAANAGQPLALITLAWSRERAGDREGAEALAQQAANAGQPLGLARLAMMREGAGDREGAKALARQAANAGQPLALIALAWGREGARGWAGAEARARLTSKVRDAGALSALASLRADAGDLEGAEALAQQATDAGQPLLLLLLASMREIAGTWDGPNSLALVSASMLQDAEDWVDTECHHRSAGYADLIRLATRFEQAIDLARMREQAGDREAAEFAYRRAADASEYFSQIETRRWPYGLEPDGSPTPPW